MVPFGVDYKLIWIQDDTSDIPSGNLLRSELEAMAHRNR